MTAPLEGGRAALLATLPGLSDTPWRPREVTYELHAQPQSLEQVLAAVYRAVCAEDNAKPFEKPVARLVGSAACLLEDGAPSASLNHLKPRGSPVYPGAPPQRLAGSPWPQQLASGRPKVEDVPASLHQVALADAPDYYNIIKDPLDLSTIGQRLQRGYYATPQMLLADVCRMCDNCKMYNGLDSM